MDCTEFLSRYSDYDDSLVSGEEVARFRVHMDGCSSCARYDRVLRKGRMLARQAPGVEPSDDFVGGLHLRLWREARRDVERARRASRLATGLAAVTVMVVAVAGIGLIGRGGGPGEGPRTVAVGAVAPAGEIAPGLASGARPAEGLPALPATDAPEPRPWGVQRVDRRIASSYSPLVTGPPAYRSPEAMLEASITLRRTLD
jgi:hypothetical protein